MACRGWYTALLPDEAAALLAATKAVDRVEILDSLYQVAESDGRIQSVDKSWDAMHRILCGGWLDFKHGDETLRAVVIGGRRLSEGPDWIISYVEPPLVQKVSATIAGLSEDWFRTQYFVLDRNPRGWFAHRYEMDLSDQDFEYTWAYFLEVREFYQRAAGRGLATVFTVDQ